MSDASLEKFLWTTVELLDTIIQVKTLKVMPSLNQNKKPNFVNGLMKLESRTEFPGCLQTLSVCYSINI